MLKHNELIAFLCVVLGIAMPIAQAQQEEQETVSDTVQEEAREAGEEKEPGEALERIEKKVDKLVEDHETAHINALKQPLQNKRYGIELNPFRIIAFTEDPTFSGGFSYFNTEENIELSFPFYWEGHEKGEPGINVFTIDAHYRYFLGETTYGFYISGFSRLASISGVVDRYELRGEFYQPTGEKDSVVKFGLGVGIGYRIFSQSGWFWGMSFNVGRYLNHDDDIYFANNPIDNAEYIFDVELFKMGYAF